MREYYKLRKAPDEIFKDVLKQNNGGNSCFFYLEV